MRKIVAIGVAFTLLGMGFATVGHARPAKSSSTKNQQQETRVWKDCAAELPNTIIPACTSIIQKNEDTPEKLARAYIYRGMAYKSKGALETAIADFNHAIELQPHSAEAFAERGNAYSILDKDDRAFADFDEAIRLQPDYVSVYDHKGWSLYDKDLELAKPNFVKTIELATKEIAANRNLARNYQDRADAYCGIQDYDRAIADFNKALRLKPDYLEALRNRGATYFFKGDYERALADLNEVLESQPDRYLGLFFRAYTYYMKGDYDRAIKDFDQAISLAPLSVNQYSGRGVAYAAKGNFDQAIANYDEAIRLNDNKYAYANRGWAYINKGDQDRALIDFNRAVTLDPKLLDAHTGLAYIYNTREMYDLAHAESERAIQINPKTAYPYVLRGMAYKGKREHDKALADFNHAIEIDPKAYNAYFNRSLLYIVTQQFQKSADDVSALMRLRPDIADHYQWRGSVISLMKDGKNNNEILDRAIVDFSEAIRMQPNHRLALSYRSDAYKEKGDVASALNDLNEIVRFYPDDPTVYIKRAQFQTEQYKYDEAINDLSAALRIKPSDIDTLFERARVYGLNSNPQAKISDLTKIISKKDDFEKKYDAYFQRADTYEDMENITAAMSDLNEIIHGYSTHIKPDMKGNAYLRRAGYYKEQNKLDEAVADYNEAIRLVPKNWAAHRDRAWIQVQSARYNDATTNLKELVELQLDDWAVSERGWAHWKNGNNDQAIADFSETVRLNPQNLAAISILNHIKEVRQERLAAAQGKFDLATSPIIGSADRVSTLAVSLDGKRMVMGGIGRVTLWEVSSGKLLRVLEGNHFVKSAVFSPDGTQFIIGSWDGVIRSWDAATGKLLRTINAEMMLSSMALSPNGSELLIGGIKGIKLWDANGQPVAFNARDWGVKAIAFSPDGSLILSGNNDGSVELWERASGKLIRTFSGHKETVTSVAFSPDGTHVLSGSDDRTMKLWELATGKQIQTHQYSSRHISVVAFSQDGNRILVQLDGETELWDAKKWQKQQSFLNQHFTAFLPDSANILTISPKKAELWDTATGKSVRSFGGGFQDIHTVILSRDKTRLFTGSDAFRVWDAKLGQLTLAAPGKMRPVSYFPSTDALSGSLDDVAQTFISTQQLAVKYDIANRVVVSPDGLLAFTFGKSKYNAFGNLWHVGSGLFQKELNTHTKHISAAAFLSDSASIAIAGNDSNYDDQLSIKLSDTTSGNVLKTIEYTGSEITTLSASSDKMRLVSGHRDGSITMWDVTSGKEVWRRLPPIFDYHGHKADVPLGGSTIETIAFSSDGRWVLSGGQGNIARLWDAQSGALLRSFGTHSDHFNVVLFSQDGSQIVTSGDGKTTIWDTASGARLVTFWGAGDEWLAMTPEGFFKSSPKGAEMFSVKLGTEYYQLTQFRDRLQRPDLIEELLKGDPQGRYKDAVLLLSTQALLKP